MLKTLKNLGRAIIPRFIFKALQPYWHGSIALLANAYFGNPSKDIIVIGVTGTNGKSTTVNLIASVLEEAGHKTGLISTVNFKVSDTEKLNDMKMTTPSGWLMQKWLREMVRNNFEYAVLEISSQGLEQNRHLGINFDVAVFTNLTPEHIEAHGGFDQYKKAKGLLFSALKQNQTGRPTTVIANADDDHFEYFINFPAETHISFGVTNSSANLIATNVEASPNGVSFQSQNTPFKLQLKGKFDVYNALAAIAVAQSQNISLDVCKTALEKIVVVPGRMEIVQAQPFMVLVDYAPEPYSLQALYDTVARWPKQRMIHILGSTGGGRDRARRQTLGQMAGKTADMVIVTNEDPYDDNPQAIINEVAGGAFSEGKVSGENLFAILDRREAIGFAVKQAKPGDLVLITGKGSEQKMAVAHGNYIDWDDRQVAREELAKL